jgi:outer membrane protein insertion porin family
MKGGSSPVDKLWILLLITCGAFLTVAPAASFAADQQAVAVNLLPAAAGEHAQVVAQARDGIEIKSIAITGLEHLDESAVLTGLTIKTGDVIVLNATKKLNDAAEALYNTGWFRSKPLLSLGGAGDGAILEVEVEENPPYRGARITGNTLFSTERLLQEIEGTVGADGQLTGAKLIKGEVINSRKLFEGIDGIMAVYQDAGYIGAGVTNPTIIFAGEDMGMVEIPVTEGIVDEVVVTGLNKTKESVVTSQITHLQSGTVLERSRLERDLNQIYNTGLFESVVPNLEPSLKPGHVRVVIQVEEAPTGQAGFGLGYSTVNGLQGSVSYREKNLFGRGKQIGATVTFSNSDPGFDISYTDPYGQGGSFWGVGLYSVNERQQRNPGTTYESELNVDKAGANVFWGQKLNDYDSYQLSFGVADYDYEITRGDPFQGTDVRQRARLSAEGQTRKLGASFSHDTRDNIFETNRGYLGRVSTEFAGFGGDFAFNKWILESREFFEVGPGTLGFRQQLGLANGDVPIYEEFRHGGVNSIRGVSEDLITGTHALLSNTEYRIPLSRMFSAVAFLDAGWAGSSFSDMDNAAGAGVGARIKIPALGLGAVRLDYGVELAGEEGTNKRFHFFLGEMF